MMIKTHTYIKAHYRNAKDLYSDLEWLTSGLEVLNIIDNQETVTVVYKV